MKELPDDYSIRLVDLPESVGGFMSECPDGHVDVYINAKWGHNGQMDAAEHEFDHWRNDDLHNDKDIREVEGRTRGLKLMKARDLPRPGKRHDKVEMQIQQEKLDNWKGDPYLKLEYNRWEWY